MRTLDDNPMGMTPRKAGPLLDTGLSPRYDNSLLTATPNVKSEPDENESMSGLFRNVNQTPLWGGNSVAFGSGGIFTPTLSRSDCWAYEAEHLKFNMVYLCCFFSRDMCRTIYNVFVKILLAC